MKTTVLLIRHGETEWNILGKFQGSTDIPLSQEGIRQAHMLKNRLNGDFDYVYASPLKRAYETALILKGNRNIDVICEPGLRELSFGEYEGYTEEELLKEGRGYEIAKIFKGEMNIRCPKGETLEELYERVKIALDKILAQSNNKKILIVYHGMALKAIVNYFRKNEGFFDEIMGQVTLSKVISDNNEFKFEFINDGSHFNEDIKSGW